MLFFAERKASKEPQASGLTVSAAGSGSVAAIKDGVHARGASRDPSTAAPILNIVPEGAHTARALRPQAQMRHTTQTVYKNLPTVFDSKLCRFFVIPDSVSYFVEYVQL